MKANEKTDVVYWNNIWLKNQMPELFNLESKDLNYFVQNEMHKFFLNVFKDKKHFKIIEIGSGNSIWPVYFNKNFNADISCLDYSKEGCEKSKKILNQYHVNGEVFQRDLFDDNSDLVGKYDYVVSFGVAEHFDDITIFLNACSRFLKADGEIITFIPNLSGPLGSIQKRLNKKVYDLHNPATKEDMIRYHEAASLNLVQCSYFTFINLCVLNSDLLPQITFKYFRQLLSVCSKFFWFFETKGFRFPVNRFTSPYLVARANQKKIK